MPTQRDKIAPAPVHEQETSHSENGCDCANDCYCDQKNCSAWCKCGNDCEVEQVANPWECRGREASEWLRHETHLLWQKFATFLGISVLLVAALAFTSSGALRTGVASFGLLFTIVMYVLVDRSWKYRDYYYRYSDLRQMIENDVRNHHDLYGIGTKGSMQTLFLLLFLFWVGIMIASMFFVQVCFFGPACVAF